MSTGLGLALLLHALLLQWSKRQTTPPDPSLFRRLAGPYTVLGFVCVLVGLKWNLSRLHMDTVGLEEYRFQDSMPKLAYLVWDTMIWWILTQAVLMVAWFHPESAIVAVQLALLCVGSLHLLAGYYSVRFTDGIFAVLWLCVSVAPLRCAFAGLR